MPHFVRPSFSLSNVTVAYSLYLSPHLSHFLSFSLSFSLSLALLRLSMYLFISVSDPSHFDVDPDPDPDPGIHIWEKWIRILGSTFP